MFIDARTSSASPRESYTSKIGSCHYARCSGSTDKGGGEVIGRRRRRRSRCSALWAIFKVKGISERGTDARARARAKGVCKRQDQADEERKGAPAGARTTGKLRFAITTRLKSRPALQFRPVSSTPPPPTSYIRTAINPRQSRVLRSTVPRGYLRCKRKVRVREDRGDELSLAIGKQLFFRRARNDKQSVAVAANEQPFASPY